VATVGTNRSLLASVSWDDLSSALMTVTDPIARGAFVGSTITLHLGLDDVARFLSGCTTGAVLGQSFGVSNPSTISVP
jgi:hypothetical protein